MCQLIPVENDGKHTADLFQSVRRFGLYRAAEICWFQQNQVAGFSQYRWCGNQLARVFTCRLQKGAPYIVVCQPVHAHQVRRRRCQGFEKTGGQVMVRIHRHGIFVRSTLDRKLAETGFAHFVDDQLFLVAGDIGQILQRLDESIILQNFLAERRE